MRGNQQERPQYLLCHCLRDLPCMTDCNPSTTLTRTQSRYVYPIPAHRRSHPVAERMETYRRGALRGMVRVGPPRGNCHQVAPPNEEMGGVAAARPYLLTYLSK